MRAKVALYGRTETKASDEAIGYCRSGKPIFNDFSHPAHKAFTPADHADAAALHAYRAGKLEDGPRGRRPKHQDSVTHGISHEDLAKGEAFFGQRRRR